MNIHEATQHGNINRVRNLLNQGTNVNTRNVRGKTPLMLASWYGFTNIAKLLIRAGANVNARTYAGRTPLIVAIDAGRDDIVRLLVLAGAKVTRNDILAFGNYVTRIPDNAKRNSFARAMYTRRTAEKVVRRAEKRFRSRKAESLLRSPRLLGSTRLTPNVIHRVASHLSAFRRN